MKYLLMNDDATVTELTQCDHCVFLFRDIEKHVAESVSVYRFTDECTGPRDCVGTDKGCRHCAGAKP